MDISFIIPAYNEERGIFRTLDGIRITMERVPDLEYEIIVGDHASHDDTRGEVHRFISTHPALKTQCCVCYDSTVAELRNYLAKQSEARFLVFLDADVVLSVDWATILNGLIDANLDYVTGSMVIYPSELHRSSIYKNWFRHIYSVRGERKYINSGHLIVPRFIFQKVDGFNGWLATGEDVDFANRLQSAGEKQVPFSELRAIHYGYPTTMKSFFLREIWHGVGDFADWETFRSSSIAKAGVVTLGCISSAFLFSVLLMPHLAVAALIPPVVLSAGYSYGKFPQLSWKERIPNVCIAAVYLLARGMSLVFRKEEKRIYATK